MSRDVRTNPRLLAGVGARTTHAVTAVGSLGARVRIWVAIGVCALGVLMASPATADSKKAHVFPLSASDLPDKLSSAPAKLTKALAAAIDAQVASVPIEDAAGLLECDPESSTCLASVAKSLSTERLVFGTISYHAGGKVKVTLTRFDVGPDRQQQTFELSGGTADALAKELVKASSPLFGGSTGDVETPPDGPLIVEDPPDDQPKTVPGKITTGTWALVGGGAVLAAGGVVMLVSAQSIKRDVQNAPTDTLEDIQRLRALEDRGAQRTLIGNVLLIGGGVALAAGIVRAVIQRKATTTEPMVQPVPTEGGAVIVLTVIR